ncbi:MAG: hypothetical protein Q9220_000777 [cf. Caloplaca sp. 1 TL-2023]
MAALLTEATSPPPLDIPSSSHTVTVRIIDSTTRLRLDAETFWRPATKGLDSVWAPDYCFLVSNGDHHVLFDLGTRCDWQNGAPAFVKIVQATTTVEVKSNVSQILDSDDSGLRITSRDISAIIWSHHHFDHTGDPSTFPHSTMLVVGPGFNRHLRPGYPTNPSAMLLDSDTAGRFVHEVDFNMDGTRLTVAGFPAIDYFHDGSFYILDAPGHAHGHLCGLARVTTTPDTFIFMGADACHHPGLLRPSPYLPLPRVITPSPIARFGKKHCPGSALKSIHAQNSATEPFFKVSEKMFPDQKEAQETVDKIIKLDASPEVFVILAHDASLEGHISIFPERIDGWHAQGLKSRTRWLFCKDFENSFSDMKKIPDLT